MCLLETPGILIQNKRRVDDRNYLMLCNLHGFFLEKPRRGDHFRIYLKRQVVNILEAKNLDILLLVKDVVGILTICLLLKILLASKVSYMKLGFAACNIPGLELE